MIYGHLLAQTKALVFFAVPHRGADVAFWADFGAKILHFGQLGLGTNPNFVADLKKNSPSFAEISRQFIERAASVTIRTFYETEMLHGHQVISLTPVHKLY